MDNWFSNITAWLLGLVQSIFAALLSFIHDAFVWLFDGILSAIAALIAAIPVPSFLASGVNVASYFTGFPAFTFYVLDQLQIGACLAVISSGVLFRLTRKAFTLFQW